MKILKKIITILLALVVFAGTTFYEQGLLGDKMIITHVKPVVVPNDKGATLVRAGVSTGVQGQTDVEVGDAVKTGENQTAIIALARETEMRLAPGSVVVFLGEDVDKNGYVFKVQQGRVWVNADQSTSTLNIVAGSAFLLPSKAVFDIAYDGSSLKLQVFESQVSVGLTASSFSPNKLYQSLSDVFINHYLVAEGNQTIVPNEKVSQNEDILRKLLYSKLIKEFQYNRFDPKVVMSDEWVVANMKYDGSMLQSVAKDRLNKINERNLKVGSIDDLGYQMGKFIDGFANVLTFSDDRVAERRVNAVIVHLMDAEYLLIYGRSTEATSRLNLFKQMVAEESSQGGEKVVTLLNTRLKEIYASLGFVLANDPLYAVKTTVADMLLNSAVTTDDDLRGHFEYVRDYLNAAIKVSPSSVALARANLDNYYDRLNKLMVSQSSQKARLKSFVYEENQIFDNVLRQYSAFYQDATFAKKHNLELEWLKFVPEGNEKDEEKQTMIGTKIDFLKVLQAFVLSEKVSLSDAKPIALRLINEIQDYKTGNEVGVSDLFNLRLQDYGEFLRFLNATDISSLPGVTINDKYKSFQASQLERISIEKAIEDFLGGKTVNTPTVTPEQIMGRVEDDFTKAKITGAKFSVLSGIEQKLIKVLEAQINGISFTADYDWDKKLISNVQVGNNVVSTGAIRLESLSELLVPAEVVPPPAPPIAPPPAATQDTKADRVAKILLLQKLKAQDITATEATIVIEDMSGGMYVVNGGHLISNPDIQLAFGFRNKENMAFSIIVRTETADQTIEGDVALSELAEKAKEVYKLGKKPTN
ncbi:FecR domain-containing protein [Candidatus Peregrinibacteria bacterium]|nr:FecR domain-containing protein [Candidatus Peregrinibacteria bacterium]